MSWAKSHIPRAKFQVQVPKFNMDHRTSITGLEACNWGLGTWNLERASWAIRFKICELDDMNKGGLTRGSSSCEIMWIPKL